MPSDELPADRSAREGHRRVRRVAFRVVLVFFALVSLTFGFGVIDFASGFTSVDDPDPLGIGVLSVAYGAVAGIVLPVAFLALLRAPQRRPAAVQQLAAVGLAFALAGTIGLDPLSFIFVGMVVVMLAAVLAQSSVSGALACLRDCGVAESRPQGRASLWSLTAPEQVLEVLGAAEQLLAVTGDAVTLCPAFGEAVDR